MERLTVQDRWKIRQGFALQIVAMTLVLVAGSAMQFYLGSKGLITTQLMLLALAVITALIHRTSLKEVFPVRKIGLMEFLGLLSFFAGGYLMNVLLTGISFMILPSASSESSVIDVLTVESGPIMAVLTVALLPAICEEAVERGAVMSHFRSVGKEWAVVLIMGIFFGLFHMSPGRFLNTAFMGALLTYIMIRKNNILLPVILHFMNNLMSMFSWAGMEDPKNISSFMLISFSFPLFLAMGNRLLCPDAFRRRHLVVAAAASLILLVAGLGGTYLDLPGISSDNTSLEVKVYSEEIHNDAMIFVNISTEYLSNI